VAVKQVRVSDLSGQQADDEQFAKLIVHEHPQYQGPIALDVLPEEIGELPDSEQYVSVEVIQPRERSGQRALLSVDRFNKLATSGDMNAILMNAVAAQQPPRPPQPRRRGRRTRDGQASGRRKVEWGLWTQACSFRDQQHDPLGVTVTVRWIPLVPARYGTWVARPARTTMLAPGGDGSRLGRR
jgi:hypothetical protein